MVRSPEAGSGCASCGDRASGWTPATLLEQTLGEELDFRVMADEFVHIPVNGPVDPG